MLPRSILTRTASVLALAVVLFATFAHAALAAEAAWPARPVRIIVAQAPGGPPDLIGRYVAERLGRSLGTPVVVENRAGASGIIGIVEGARAQPDGHTLVVTTLSTHALVPHVAANVPYDPLRDFAAVSNLFRSIKAVWVNPRIPARTLPEFVALAKARPGELNFASGGVGSSNHVDVELFKAATGIDLMHVPYNGPSAGIAAVASGDVQMMIVSITTGVGLAQGGKVRPLVVFSEERSPLLPDVPTGRELGLSGLDLTAWIGLMAPAGTPVDIVSRLNREIDAILASPETAAWAQRHGLEIARGSAESFARTVADDYARWGDAIRGMHVQRQ